MPSLELKVPPLILALAVALTMVELDRLYPLSHPEFPNQGDHAIIIGFIGIVVAAVAVFQFRKAQTTVNPTAPEDASSLVETGIFKYSRNPMYLGFLLVIIGLALLLANPIMWSGPVLFVFYLNKFQIVPEEKALKAQFKNEYTDYCKKVRRWI